MKLKTVIAVITAMAIILGLSIVIAKSNGSAGDGHYTWEEYDQIAREYLLNSATFQFDGQEETIELSIVMAPSDSDESKMILTYTFQTGHSGHGDRSDMIILPVITDHCIDITVENGKVTSAICCGVWDEMAGEYLDN
jgi:hypothetical protein